MATVMRGASCRERRVLVEHAQDLVAAHVRDVEQHALVVEI